MSNGNNFGYIYDWMEKYDMPEEYTQFEGEEGKEALLLKLYNEMTGMMDPENVLDYDQWKQTYGRYIEEYNPAEEKLTQESFDIKYGQTEKLFDLKSNQEERDYALIDKYASIDDSDNFESSTELAIRHKEETDKIDKKINRYKLISEGVSFNQKKKLAEDKSLLKNIQTGETDQIVSELDKTFWNNMKVVRSEFDKQRIDKNQALDKLLLKSEQTMDTAFQQKEDNIESLLVSSQGKLKNAAVELLGDKIELREDYEDEAWDTMGELAVGDAFLDVCSPACDSDTEYCFRGQCYPKESNLFYAITIDETTAGFEDIKDHWMGEDGILPELTCVMKEDGPGIEDCVPTDEYYERLNEQVGSGLEELSEWSSWDMSCILMDCPFFCKSSRGC